MARSRILQTIQRSFMKLMPVTMIGGFASLFKGIDFGGYQAWLQATPLQMANLVIHQAGKPLPNMVTGGILSFSSGSLPCKRP